MAKTHSKRDIILDIAERAVLTKGFAATSIEEIIAEAEITKGGFFYHFKDKNALARALIERSLEQEDAVFNQVEARAWELTDDPLQFLLIALKLFAEALQNQDRPHYGSLISAVVYQEQLFDHTIVEMNQKALQTWETRLTAIFTFISSMYEMADDVPLEDLAGMMTTILEGAVVYGKAIGKPDQRPAQLMAYRSYLKLLFHRRKSP